MNSQILIILAVIIILICIMSSQNEKYVNIYGDYIDAPFVEKDDRECRQLCNRMEGCAGYNYDPLTGTCYMHGKDGNYLVPFGNHFLYPYYDSYLYNNAWWIWGPRYSKEELYNMGYRGNRWGGHMVHNKDIRNKALAKQKRAAALFKGGKEGRRGVNNNGRVGTVMGLPGGGHGGRIGGALPSTNELKVLFRSDSE